MDIQWPLQSESNLARAAALQAALVGAAQHVVGIVETHGGGNEGVDQKCLGL